MSSIIIPASNKEHQILFVGDPSYGIILDFRNIKRWIDNHKADWPRNFYLLQQSFGVPIRLELFPEASSKEDLVWIVSTPSADHLNKVGWDQILNHSGTLIIVDYHISLQRISRKLVPFL